MAKHIISWRLRASLTPNSVYSAKDLTWISSSQSQPLYLTPYKVRLSQRGEEVCIFVWKLDAAVPDKQCYCQTPPGAKGMWKILAAMTVAVVEAVCYLLISGYFPNFIGLVWLLPPHPPVPMKADIAGHRIFLALGMPVGPHQKPLSATSLSFLHFSLFLFTSPHWVCSFQLSMSPEAKDETFRNPEISILSEVRNKPEETRESLFKRMWSVLLLTFLAEGGYKNLII